jgi:glucokinase
VQKGEKTKLFKLMDERGRTRLTSSVWQKALEHHDRLATELFDEAVAALATGIASAQNLLDVEAVIVGGGLGTRFGQPLADRIAGEMQPHLFHDSNPPAVRSAALGDLGGAIGAALLARRQTRRRRPARHAATR